MTAPTEDDVVTATDGGGPSGGRFAFVVLVCLVGIAILAGLGIWQVERLNWKNAIVQRIDARIHAAPVAVADIAARFSAGDDIDYVPATASGTFDHRGERYFLSTFDGRAGWNVYTPLVLGDGSAVLFVNRGFVPYDRKDPATRPQGNPAGATEVTGLSRSPAEGKTSWFMPDNDPAKNTFFWRSVPDMAAGLALPEGVAVLPFTLDAGPGKVAGGLPVGGTTVIDIPNNHLQYAITWFGLAAVLAVMFVLFLWRRAASWRGSRPA